MANWVLVKPCFYFVRGSAIQTCSLVEPFIALLGEADILAGQVLCPRSPPDAIASFYGIIPPPDKWVVPNVCAYVPQSAWLRNASIKGVDYDYVLNHKALKSSQKTFYSTSHT